MSYNGIIEITNSDSDFYERKIIRLQDDISILHDELTQLRAKLRFAQDFQIKYHILLKNSETQIHRLKQGQQTAGKDHNVQNITNEKIRENNYKWQQRLAKLEQDMKNQNQHQLDQIRQQRDQYRRRLSENALKREQSDSLNFKIKKIQNQNQTLQQQIEDIRIHYQRQKEEQLTNLRSHLGTNFKERMANERKMYEQKISSLQKKLFDRQIEKDNQIFKLPASSNSQLIALKQLFQQKGSKYQKEIHQINTLLHERNQDIKKLLQQKRQKQQRYISQIQQRDLIITELQNKITLNQKQNQFYLIQNIQKAKQQRSRQNSEYMQQIRQLQIDKDNQNKIWANRLLNQDRQVQNINKKHEQQVKKLNEDKHQLKKKISDLANRLQQYEGQRGIGSTQHLITSLRQLDVKESNMATYQNGVTFLQRQLKKCQNKLQQKSRALMAATKQINNIRIQSQREAAQMIQKLSQARTQFNVKVVSFQQQIAVLNQQLRSKQRQIKTLQREAITTKHQNDIQLKKLKDLLQEVQRDYDRLIQNKKQTDTNYRTQREKAFNSTGEINIARKQKWLQLQRQKNQLKTVYRQKQEQLKLKFQNELQNQRLKLNQLGRNYEIAEKQIELLKKQNDRLKQQSQSNKQNKHSDFHSKIATINLELALTQNIYDHLIKGKNKTHYTPANQIQQVQQRQDISYFNTESMDPLLLSFDPNTSRKQ